MIRTLKLCCNLNSLDSRVANYVYREDLAA